MKTQKYGVEIELTGITREEAATTIAAYYGTNQTSYQGGTYYKWTAKDSKGRTWTAMYDGSINTCKRNGEYAGSEYSCEIVTPILEWSDIEDLQEIVRQLRHKGAIANSSCGIHVHVDATGHTAQTIRNLVNIMTSKEDMLFKAIGVSPSRADRWCQKNDAEFVRKMNRIKPTQMDKVENLWYNGESRRYAHYDSSRYHALNLHSLWQGKGFEFRCFNGTTHAGKIKTYIQLCLAITNQAKTQKGASARRTTSTNECFTFRTWLIRMGMNGDEFKTARDFLLNNLEGNKAWRYGRPGGMA